MIGAIVDFAGPLVPTNYLLCDGAAYLKTDYPELYGAIGATWDTFRGQAGPGADYFRVPLLNGLVSVGTGLAASNPATDARAFADVGGESKHTLIVAELPAHDHPVIDPGHTHAQLASNNPFVTEGSFLPQGTADGTSVAGCTVTTSSEPALVTVGNTGTDNAHNNLPPYVGLLKVIRAR